MEFLKENKIRLFIILFLIFTALLTGIFTALKADDIKLYTFDYLIYDYVEGEIITFNALFNRLLSVEVVFAIVTIASLSPLLSTIGYFVLIYRSYLVGFNITIIVINFGLTGVFSSLIVLLSQLIILFTFSLFFIIMISRAKTRSKYGKSACRTKFGINHPTLITQIMLVLIVLIETILFVIFQSKVILSI